MDAIIDYRGKTPNKVAHGVPLITAKIVKDGAIEKPTEFVAESEYEAWMRRGLPIAGDVVLTTEAPLGEVAQLEHARVALAQRIILLRGKKNELDNTFLRFLLQSEAVKSQLTARSSGTTVSGIKQSELRKVRLSLPPFPEQLEIASVLRALSDAIQLKFRANQTLEAIARAIFKSWFVDFDPVRAKAEGREPEGMDAATAAIFPSEFEKSSLGPIPNGWNIGRLDDLLVLQRGFDLPSIERTPGPFPIIAASGPSGTHSEYRVKGPGVVTGRSGVLGSVYWVDDDFWPLNTSLWIKEYKRATPTYALQHLGTLDLSGFNAGSAVPTLNRNHIHGLPTVVPPPAIVQAFDEIATSLFASIRIYQKQAATLTDVRDTLLPRLISGKLRVPEAEKLVEAVL